MQVNYGFLQKQIEHKILTFERKIFGINKQSEGTSKI